MRTYPHLALGYILADGYLATCQISTQSVQSFPRYGKGGTSARAHVQMYPTHDLLTCIASWSLNTHQIWSQSAFSFLIYSLMAKFYTPSLCTCHVPQWLPRWMGVGSIHGRRDVATHQRRPFVNQTRGCRDISSSKASWGRVGSCRVGSCRADHA